MKNVKIVFWGVLIVTLAIFVLGCKSGPDAAPPAIGSENALHTKINEISQRNPVTIAGQSLTVRFGTRGMPSAGEIVVRLATVLLQLEDASDRDVIISLLTEFDSILKEAGEGIWIAYNDGRQILGGRYETSTDGTNLVLTLYQTHLYSYEIKPGPPPVGGGEIGWISARSPELVFSFDVQQGFALSTR